MPSINYSSLSFSLIFLLTSIYNLSDAIPEPSGSYNTSYNSFNSYSSKIYPIDTSSSYKWKKILINISFKYL
jgi:hypothetical protein